MTGTTTCCACQLLFQSTGICNPSIYIPPVNRIIFMMRHTNTKQTKNWNDNMLRFPIAVPVHGHLQELTNNKSVSRAAYIALSTAKIIAHTCVERQCTILQTLTQIFYLRVIKGFHDDSSIRVIPRRARSVGVSSFIPSPVLFIRWWLVIARQNAGISTGGQCQCQNQTNRQNAPDQSQQGMFVGNDRNQCQSGDTCQQENG